MNIWHVENKEYTSLMLWRTSHHSFRLTIRGEFKPLLTNHDYILMDKRYVPLLKTLPDQVALQDVIIYDLTKQTEIDNYTELKVKHEINPDTIDTDYTKGLKIWSYPGKIFVSTELKESLLSVNKSNLVFTLGFSNFAG